MFGPMEFRDEAEMERLACGMMACTLPKEEWTHAAHFAAALWLMARRPEMDLTAEMPRLIRAYNESLGGKNTETSGYHETITQASLLAARAFLRERDGEPLVDTMNSLLRSPLGRSDWWTAYWSREVLFSVEARRQWVAPDLEEIPWK